MTSLDQLLTDNIEQYRTEGLPPGYFSKLGNLHVHVDGGTNLPLVRRLLESERAEGEVSKLNRVVAYVGGPQRTSLADTYASHTPGAKEAEEFEYFATVGFKNRTDAVRRVSHLISELADTAGVVIEMEQVVGRKDANGPFVWLEQTHEEPISQQEVPYEKDHTLRFEIHHGFDVSPDQPISLPNLLSMSTERGIEVGGWFCFARTGELSYRSNAFRDVSAEPIASGEHSALNDLLVTMGVQTRLRTVVERVLGVWRTPARSIML